MVNAFEFKLLEKKHPEILGQPRSRFFFEKILAIVERQKN